MLREQLFEEDDTRENANIHIAMFSNSRQRIGELILIVKNQLLQYDK